MWMRTWLPGRPLWRCEVVGAPVAVLGAATLAAGVAGLQVALVQGGVVTRPPAAAALLEILVFLLLIILFLMILGVVVRKCLLPNDYGTQNANLVVKTFARFPLKISW